MTSRASRLAATFGLLGLAVAGCGGASNETSTSPTTTDDEEALSPGTSESPEWPEDADPAGELTLGYSVPPPGLDPDLVPQSAFPYIGPVYDRLTSISDELVVEPMLATAWTPAEDGTYLDMALRDDVTFHDGTPFDAGVVQANIERSKQLQGSRTASSLQSVESVEIIDDQTVRFHLVPGHGAELPTVLAGFAGMMENPAAHEDPTLGTAAVAGAGSGPYEIAEYQPGVSVVLVPATGAEEHWDVGAGLVSRLTIQVVETSAQRMNGVQAGDLDISQVTGPDVAQAEQLAASDQFDGRRVVPVGIVQMLGVRPSLAPWDNATLRQAIQFAIDREAISAGLYGGTCTLANQYYGEGHWAHFDSIGAGYEFDPARAQELVEESGLENPSVTITHMPPYAALAQAVQAQLIEVGIDADLQPLPVPDVIAGWTGGQIPAVAQALTGGVDPVQVINENWLSGYNLVPEGTVRDELQRIADEAADVTLTQDERAALYEDFFRIIDEEAYYVPICYGDQFWLQQAGGVGALDRLMHAFSGAVDPRYLYRPQT